MAPPLGKCPLVDSRGGSPLPLMLPRSQGANLGLKCPFITTGSFLQRAAGLTVFTKTHLQS